MSETWKVVGNIKISQRTLEDGPPLALRIFNTSGKEKKKEKKENVSQNVSA